MSFVSSKKSRLLVGDFNLASYGTQVNAAWSVDVLDWTVFPDTAKVFGLGQDTATMTVAGLYDTAEHADLAALKGVAAGPVTLGLNGFAVGSEVWLVNVLETDLETSADVAGSAMFSFGMQCDGIVDMGVSLADHAAVTADANGTTVDGAAATAGGAVAHLHATAFSGFSGVAAIVEDSANSTDWATIGTFSSLAAAGSERLVIAGTVRRYTRVRWDVTGTGSVTAQVSLARR